MIKVTYALCKNHWQTLYKRRILQSKIDSVKSRSDRMEIQTQIDALTRKVEREESSIIDIVNAIPEAMARIACRRRYVDGCTWQEIATALGGNTTPDSAYQLCTRAIKKQVHS